MAIFFIEFLILSLFILFVNVNSEFSSNSGSIYLAHGQGIFRNVSPLLYTQLFVYIHIYINKNVTENKFLKVIINKKNYFLSLFYESA